MSESAPAAYRLFVAILIPAQVKQRIEAAQAELGRAAPKASIGWTRSEQFHLTVKFLGDVEVPRVDELERVLGSVTGALPQLRLRAEGMGFFPNAMSPRVVWAGLRDEADQLPWLQSAVEAACAPFSKEPAQGKSTGHVTLGRIKRAGRIEIEALGRAVSGMTERRFGEWTADNIELMRSELLAGGARHSSLAVMRLG